MSQQKVNHSVWHAMVNQSVTAGSGSYTTEWWDVNGWTDKVVTYDQDVTDGSGSLSLTLTMDVSPLGYYELNNSTALATTENYATVTVVSAGSAAVATRVDSSDVDDLQRPMRSVRFKAVNGDASDNSTVNVWLEGWS